MAVHQCNLGLVIRAVLLQKGVLHINSLKVFVYIQPWVCAVVVVYQREATSVMLGFIHAGSYGKGSTRV